MITTISLIVAGMFVEHFLASHINNAIHLFKNYKELNLF